MNLDTDFTTFTKINSKWIPDLNVECRTIKLLEDNVGENLDDLGYGSDFLGTTPQALSMKGIIDQLDFIKIKNFCPVKDNAKRMRRQSTDGEKIFAKDITYKEVLSKKHKEFLKLNNKKMDSLIKKWAKDLNRHLSKEDIQMANKPVKGYLASYVIRELKIRTMTYCCAPNRMAKI
uniref:Uncharacterized protein n=1 Tax=Equus caballus TaxID=9796 RepID=A0A9L0SM96_HORSE